MKLTKISLKPYVKAARELAGEWAGGDGPRLSVYDYAGCAMGQVVKRVIKNERYALINEKELDNICLEGKGRCLVSSALFWTEDKAFPLGEEQRQLRMAAVFPLLAWADEAEKKKFIEIEEE